MNEKKIWILSVEARHNGDVLDYEGVHICESKLAAQQQMQREIQRVSHEDNCFTNGGSLIAEGFNVERNDDGFDCWSPNKPSTYLRMVIEERPIIAEAAMVIDPDTTCDDDVREVLNTAWSVPALRQDWVNILHAVAVRDDDERVKDVDDADGILSLAPEILNKLCDESDLRMIALFLRLL